MVIHHNHPKVFLQNIAALHHARAIGVHNDDQSLLIQNFLRLIAVYDIVVFCFHRLGVYGLKGFVVIINHNIGIPLVIPANFICADGRAEAVHIRPAMPHDNDF